MNWKKRVIAVALVLVLALALAPAGIVGADKGPAVVVFKPQSKTIGIGDLTDIQVWVNNVTDFYGLSFEFTFNAVCLTGMSVVEGPAFTGVGAGNYWVMENSITGNTVRFTASLLGVPSLSGNLHVATITFLGKDIGNSALAWSSITLANPDGVIPHLSQNGAIYVREQVAVVDGFAVLQGRTVHNNVSVDLMGPIVGAATTDASGKYSFANVNAGTYNLLMSHAQYLTAKLDTCTVAPSAIVHLPAVTLVAGDLVNDEVINILDLVKCASLFGTADAQGDANGDGTVDILDLVLIGSNFNKTGPVVIACP